MNQFCKNTGISSTQYRYFICGWKTRHGPLRLRARLKADYLCNKQEIIELKNRFGGRLYDFLLDYIIYQTHNPILSGESIETEYHDPEWDNWEKIWNDPDYCSALEGE